MIKFGGGGINGWDELRCEFKCDAEESDIGRAKAAVSSKRDRMWHTAPAFGLCVGSFNQHCSASPQIASDS
jgi:hypothetical protein